MIAATLVLTVLAASSRIVLAVLFRTQSNAPEDERDQIIALRSERRVSLAGGCDPTTSNAPTGEGAWRDAHRVCDVGGRTGALLSTLLAAHTHLEGVLLELPRSPPEHRSRTG